MRKIWHLCLVVLAVVTLAACGQAPSNTSTTQEFTVAAKEFTFTPAVLNVSGWPAGRHQPPEHWCGRARLERPRD